MGDVKLPDAKPGPPVKVGTVEHWSERAAYMRRLAKRTKEPFFRNMVLRLAYEYDELRLVVEKGGGMGSPSQSHP